MEIKAIPTRYRGINMRSRLEAKWAAFFDLMNWKWRYEPVDLDGWIPDFVVGGNIVTGAYVEVKPIEWHAGEHTGDMIRQYRREIDICVDRTPETSRGFLLLGNRPIMEEHVSSIGIIYEPALGRTDTHLFRELGDDGQIDVPVGTNGYYPGLMTGLDYTTQWDENGEITMMPCPLINNRIQAAWDEACNRVQYKPW